MCTRLTMYWSVQTRTCINIPCEVPTLEEERTFTFFNGYNLSVSPVTRWWDLPGLPCSELSYWSWSNTEVVGELGMRPWRTSVPRVLRVTEKLNNTGSVDEKFLIVKRQVCNTQASRVHLKGNFFQPLKRGRETLNTPFYEQLFTFHYGLVHLSFLMVHRYGNIVHIHLYYQ